MLHVPPICATQVVFSLRQDSAMAELASRVRSLVTSYCATFNQTENRWLRFDLCWYGQYFRLRVRKLLTKNYFCHGCFVFVLFCTIFTSTFTVFLFCLGFTLQHIIIYIIMLTCQNIGLDHSAAAWCCNLTFASLFWTHSFSSLWFCCWLLWRCLVLEM